MAALREFIQYATSNGQPIVHGDTVFTPISRVLTIKLPFWGFVWNRPVGLRIEDKESTTTLPIVDVTLLAQASLVFVSLSAVIVALIASGARKK